MENALQRVEPKADLEEEKMLAREADILRLESGEISPAQMNEHNGFFSSLDRRGASILKRRVRISLG